MYDRAWALRRQDGKMQDWKMQERLAWVENADLENGGPVWTGI